MLLIDTIINCDNQCNAALGARRPDLVRELKASAKFVLEKSFAEAADSLPDEEISRVIECARPPFENSWVEVAACYRSLFDAAQLDHGTMRPQRVGILVHANAPQFSQFVIDLFWSFNKHTFDISPISMVADLSSQERWGNYVNYVSEAGQNLPQDHFIKRFAPASSRYTMFGPDFISRNRARLFKNWGGEVEFWSGVFALLSCRNAASVEAVTRSAALKRSTRKTLSDYHLCTVRLPKFDRVTHEGAGAGVSHRAHFVRGHFKRRKTGLFWWTPHGRGDISRGFVTKDYRVTA